MPPPYPPLQVMRYLHKRIDNKMDKELTTSAPPFSRLVDDVARTMETCGEPNRTYSMSAYDDLEASYGLLDTAVPCLPWLL